MSEPQEELVPHPQWLRHEIDEIDLFILRELNKGTSPSAIDDKISEEFKIATTDYKINERIERMKKERIILKEHATIIDPMKLYDHVYLAFIKVALSSLISGAAKTWEGAFAEIKKRNEEWATMKPGRTPPIRLLFNVGGIGQYDFAALIYFNNPEEYHHFKAFLVDRTNIIESFDTKYVDTPFLFYFDPISVPDPREHRRTIAEYDKRLKSIRKKTELTEKRSR